MCQQQSPRRLWVSTSAHTIAHMDQAKDFLFSRRAFNTRLAAAAGAVAAPLHVLADAPNDESRRVAQLADAYLDAYWHLFPVDATEKTNEPQKEGHNTIDIAPASREKERALY